MSPSPHRQPVRRSFNWFGMGLALGPAMSSVGCGLMVRVLLEARSGQREGESPQPRSTDRRRDGES